MLSYSRSVTPTRCCYALMRCTRMSKLPVILSHVQRRVFPQRALAGVVVALLWGYATRSCALGRPQERLDLRTDHSELGRAGHHWLRRGPGQLQGPCSLQMSSLVVQARCIRGIVVL